MRIKTQPSLSSITPATAAAAAPACLVAGAMKKIAPQQPIQSGTHCRPPWKSNQIFLARNAKSLVTPQTKCSQLRAKLAASPAGHKASSSDHAMHHLLSFQK
eukprot:1150768-Pelagomonas_calceolata.AAC.4